jgi:GGDEF domain-containing protein
MLGIAGVNVYLYDEPTEHLLCLQSEQMLGKSRYDRSQGKSAWKPAEGAKAYILGKEDGCYVIADRFNINTWGAEPGDSSVSAFFDQERVKGMADAALYKQQGEGIEDGKKNVREEVYIKVKGANGHTYLFVGNSHLRNVQEGYKPLFADVPGGEETVRTICDDISGLIGKSLQGAFMRTRLEVRSHQLEAVNVLSRRLDEAISAEGATGSIPQLVGTALPVIFKRLTRASIIVWDPATGTYQIAAAWGQGYHPERVYDPDGFSFTDWVLSTRRTFSYSIRDPGNRAKIPVALRQRPFYERGDFMVVPFYGREVSGVIAITSEMRRYLTPDDQATLEQIALHLATKMDNEQLIKELRYLAEHDVMTGLWNKKVGLGQLAGLFLSPAPRPPITVIGVDLDHFKWVNDTYGHIAGDKVLIELGRRMERAAEEKIVTILGRQMTTLTEQQLRAEAQKICTVMRYGGEEFAIILNGLDHSEGLEVADAVGEAIRATPFDIGGGSQVSRTASLGVASTSQFSFASPDALYYAADTACYAAKNPDTVTLEQEGEVVPFGAAGSGRNRVVLWVAGMCKVEAA